MSLLELRCRLQYATGFIVDAAFETHHLVTALLGPSGSGKSSILSMVAGLRRPDDGFIRVGERVLFDRRRGIDESPESRHIGYVFQQQLLFPHLNVRENLRYGWMRRTATRRIEPEQVLRVLDLESFLDRMPSTLSVGQRQRIALGRALLLTPELLLLDEPLAALDADRKVSILTYIEKVLGEWQIPTIYVTHDHREVRRLCRWGVQLQDGRVTVVGPLEDSTP